MIAILSCVVALTITFAGIVILLVSLLATLVTRDMSPMAAGLIGGSLLGSCGGVALVWSLGQLRKGV